MIGIPTPTCDPSPITAEDTCTGRPVGFGGFVCVDLLVPDVPPVLGADELPMMPPAVLLAPPPGATTVRVTVRPGVTWSEPHADRTRAVAALSAATTTEPERR
jgi:hypothetical protein